MRNIPVLTLALAMAVSVPARAGGLDLEQIIRGIGRGTGGDVGRILNGISIEKHISEASEAKNAMMRLFGGGGAFGYELTGELSEFRAQQSKFFNAVSAAAQMDKKDARVKALARWGNDTRVRIPGQFSEQIISTRQYWDLGVGF